MEFLLLIIAYFLRLIFSPVLFSYGILKAIIIGFKNNKFVGIYKELSEYFLEIAVSIDQFGNTLGSYLFNDLLVKKNGYKAGNRLITISYVLGRNKENNTLTLLGQFIAFILDFIDPDHCKKSVISGDKKIKNFK